MLPEQKDLTLILIGLIGVFILVLLPTIAGIFWKSYSDLVKALRENTIAIAKLQIQMENLYETIRDVPKMKKDLRATNGKIKSLFSKNGKRPGGH